MDVVALYRVEFLIALLTSPRPTVYILNHFLKASCWVCTRCVPEREEEGEERWKEERWGEERVRDKRRGEGEKKREKRRGREEEGEEKRERRKCKR